MILPAVHYSVLGRAESSGLVTFSATNPRDFSTDRHHTVDDSPFGGGPGMVMKPDIVQKAIEHVLHANQKSKVIVFEPWGLRFDQKLAHKLAEYDQLILVSGHYEGIDGRIAQAHNALVLSLGDFVLTGGELPALIVADAVTRLIPGTLGTEESLEIDSHSDGLLSGPQFTRPWDFQGLNPPEAFRNGNHQEIAREKRRISLQTTRKSRPDLFCCAKLVPGDVNLLESSS